MRHPNIETSRHRDRDHVAGALAGTREDGVNSAGLAVAFPGPEMSSPAQDPPPTVGARVQTPAGLGAAARDDLPLVVVLLLMIALGVFLRGVYLADPPTFKWDEHHYVQSARSYLRNEFLWHDHPPLGKLVVAASMKVMGDRPLAWRLPAFLCGLANIALAGLLAAHVFRGARAGLIAAAFVAVDGFFIAYSRVALLDGMIVTVGLAATLLLLAARRGWHVLAAGVCVGCAVSFKMTGLVAFALALVMCLCSPRVRRWTPLLILAVASTFYAQFAVALHGIGRPSGVLDVIAENNKMLASHLTHTYVNPSSSHWYTWFVPLKPIFLRRDMGPDGSVRVLLTLGNPLLWWAALAAVVGAAAVVARVGARRLWGALTKADAETDPRAPWWRSWPQAEDRERLARPLFWLLAAWAGPIAFWVPSLRDSYLYHYFPSYGFALPLLAGFVDRLYARRPLLMLAAILIVVEISVFYAPLWGELLLFDTGLRARLLPGWR
jgi:dolichyl-phosphate-mannose-protein mannosyltransferase